MQKQLGIIEKFDQTKEAFDKTLRNMLAEELEKAIENSSNRERILALIELHKQHGVNPTIEFDVVEY